MASEKIQKLTSVLYQEGIEKGEKKASEIVEAAKKRADEIVEKAKADAGAIIREAAFAILVLSGCTAVPGTLPPLQQATPIGFDCATVKSLPPDSPDARKIAADFIADYTETYPTEYMGFDRLYAVDRFEDFAVLQGNVTQEEIHVILIQKTANGYAIVSHFLSTHPISKEQGLQNFVKEVGPDLYAMIRCVKFDWVPE